MVVSKAGEGGASSFDRIELGIAAAKKGAGRWSISRGKHLQEAKQIAQEAFRSFENAKTTSPSNLRVNTIKLLTLEAEIRHAEARGTNRGLSTKSAIGYVVERWFKGGGGVYEKLDNADKRLSEIEGILHGHIKEEGVYPESALKRHQDEIRELKRTISEPIPGKKNYATKMQGAVLKRLESLERSLQTLRDLIPVEAPKASAEQVRADPKQALLKSASERLDSYSYSWESVVADLERANMTAADLPQTFKDKLAVAMRKSDQSGRLTQQKEAAATFGLEALSGELETRSRDIEKKLSQLNRLFGEEVPAFKTDSKKELYAYLDVTRDKKNKELEGLFEKISKNKKLSDTDRTTLLSLAQREGDTERASKFFALLLKVAPGDKRFESAALSFRLQQIKAAGDDATNNIPRLKDSLMAGIKTPWPALEIRQLASAWDLNPRLF